MEKAFRGPYDLKERMGGRLDAAEIAVHRRRGAGRALRRARRRCTGTRGRWRAGPRTCAGPWSSDYDGSTPSRSGARPPPARSCRQPEGAARLRRAEGPHLRRPAGQAPGRQPPGWEEAAGPYAGRRPLLGRRHRQPRDAGQGAGAQEGHEGGGQGRPRVTVKPVKVTANGDPVELADGADGRRPAGRPRPRREVGAGRAQRRAGGPRRPGHHRAGRGRPPRAGPGRRRRMTPLTGRLGRPPPLPLHRRPPRPGRRSSPPASPAASTSCSCGTSTSTPGPCSPGPGVAAAVCRDHGVPFVLNDRPDLALECGADGVHVGQDDAPPALARRILGPDAIVGLLHPRPGRARRRRRRAGRLRVGRPGDAHPDQARPPGHRARLPALRGRARPPGRGSSPAG